MCATRNDEVLSNLECPICTEYMISSIFVCPNGHSICGRCKQKVTHCPMCSVPLGSTKNFALESLAEALAQIYPIISACPFSAYGCNAKVNISELNEHKQKCSFRRFKCILDDGDWQCDFIGSRNALKKHLKKKHDDDFLICDTSMSPITFPMENDVYFTLYENDIFYFHIKQEGEMLYAWLQHIGSPDWAGDYLYSVRVFSNQSSKRECYVTERCVSNIASFNAAIEAGRCAAISIKNIKTYPGNLYYTLRIAT